jgi:acetyltransferase-like isoleucine patch superfamily enzyme
VLLRRHWYRRTLVSCGDDLVVDWMGVFKTPEARVGRRVFVGSLCWIAEADIRDNVMIAARTAVQGGGRTHRFDRLDVPMTEQPGDLRAVTIGPDVWIGTGVTILADVAPGTVVGAGAVVTRTFEPNVILAGVPARPVGSRSAAPAGPDVSRG